MADDLIPVKSSWIARIGRDPVTGTVTVETKGGEVYTYAGIDERLFHSWVTGPSPGGFFARHISGRFPSERKAKE